MSAKGPKLLPKKKTVSRQVFLEAEFWAELSEAADFHAKVFDFLGAEEKVSRNDLVDAFLHWALTEYWEDKGGRPISERDWLEKAKKYADRLRAEQPDKK